MTEKVREILLAASHRGRNGFPPEPSIAQAIADGNRELTIDQFKFDSLAWMEFCISVELQSGQELTPVDIDGMQYVVQIEEWLRSRA